MSDDAMHIDDSALEPLARHPDWRIWGRWPMIWRKFGVGVVGLVYFDVEKRRYRAVIYWGSRQKTWRRRNPLLWDALDWCEEQAANKLAELAANGGTP